VILATVTILFHISPDPPLLALSILTPYARVKINNNNKKEKKRHKQRKTKSEK
jgi:hypothetical protein